MQKKFKPRPEAEVLAEKRTRPFRRHYWDLQEEPDEAGCHTSGFLEGLNNKLKVIKCRYFGLLDPGRLFQRIQIDLQEQTGLLARLNTLSCA